MILIHLKRLLQNVTDVAAWPKWLQPILKGRHALFRHLFLFISFGYQCRKCAKHFIGDDSHIRDWM